MTTLKCDRVDVGDGAETQQKNSGMDFGEPSGFQNGLDRPMPEFTTNHLDLTESGLIYLRCLPNANLIVDDVECGTIAVNWWPSALGEEPTWFGVEIEQCIDWWSYTIQIRVSQSRAEVTEQQWQYNTFCVGSPQ